MTTKPNLLFIYTDEQSFDTLACYGNDWLEMPNLNRLAEQSYVFERAYVSQSVCTPSRSTLLTGLYPHTSGCIANDIPLHRITPCLPEMLGENHPYVTAHYGKWHLGDELFAQHGFQQWVNYEDGSRQFYAPNRDQSVCSDYHDFLIKNGFEPENGKVFSRKQAANLPEPFTKAAFIAGSAAKFINENRDNPFILYVNILEPHMPFTGPYNDYYDPEKIPLPINFEHRVGKDCPLKYTVEAAFYNDIGFEEVGPLNSETQWRKLRAQYYGLCSMVDMQIGKILDALEENNIVDNTIIVFTSDHGDMMGSHGLAAKCTMYEEAVRIPLLIKVPGQNGHFIKGAISQIDVVPTLLELLGYEVPEKLQGVSRVGVLDENILTDDIFIEWNGADTGIYSKGLKSVFVPESLEGRANQDEIRRSVISPVRTVITPELLKLNISYDGSSELYNLKVDPGEMNNLINNNEYQEAVLILTAKITEWQLKTEDTVGQINPISADVKC